MTEESSPAQPDNTQMSVEEIRAKIAQLTENYQIIAQGPGTAVMPREVAAGLVELAIVAHEMMSLMFHLCGYAPGSGKTHAMLMAQTPHGSAHITCLQHALNRVDTALVAGGFPAHRDFPSCAGAASANAYTQEDMALLQSAPRGTA